jgi:hypothetical protein
VQWGAVTVPSFQFHYNEVSSVITSRNWFEAYGPFISPTRLVIGVLPLVKGATLIWVRQLKFNSSSLDKNRLYVVFRHCPSPIIRG